MTIKPLFEANNSSQWLQFVGHLSATWMLVTGEGYNMSW